jgi:hypothetical protein
MMSLLMRIVFVAKKDEFDGVGNEALYMKQMNSKFNSK